MGADAAVDDADVGVSATAALCQRCRGGGRDGRGTASHMNVVGREVAAGRDILETLHRLFERKAARRGERHGAEAELLKVVFPNDREARFPRDRKSTRLNSSHYCASTMPSS